MRPAAFCLTLTALAGPATAQEVIPCDWQASAQALVEPWQDNSRTFANGAVRLALLDTIEPAAGAAHLLVLSPPRSDLGDRQCRVISYAGGAGFAALSFADLTADYDPARGLIFRLPGQIYDPETSVLQDVGLEFSLNQATGAIVLTMGLGRE